MVHAAHPRSENAVESKSTPGMLSRIRTSGPNTPATWCLRHNFRPGAPAVMLSVPKSSTPSQLIATACDLPSTHARAPARPNSSAEVMTRPIGVVPSSSRAATTIDATPVALSSTPDPLVPTTARDNSSAAIAVHVISDNGTATGTRKKCDSPKTSASQSQPTQIAMLAAARVSSEAG